MIPTLSLPTWALTTSIAIIKASTTDDGLEDKPDWSTPTTVTTVMGSLQPAGEAALERASLLGASVTHVVFMNTTSIVPAQNRLLIDSTHYVVRDAQEWGGYTRALVEVARAQP